MSESFNCYICGEPLEGNNASLEHIILNGIGGKLRSRNLLCKECNGRLGSSSDVALSESLSFYTDMLQVKKDRDNGHNQVMTDEDGHEIIVDDAGWNLKLRRSYFEKEDNGKEKIYTITARNEAELIKYLEGQKKAGELTQEQVDGIMSKAKMTSHHPRLRTRTVIPSEAFPSIVKSAVNYYIECTHRYEDVKHLIPYIEGKADCKDVLNLVMFDTLPYEEKVDEVTHMIHIEGNPKTGVLYAMMEYYSIYTYIIFMKENYDGPQMNMTYCFDVLHKQTLERNFELQMTRAWIEDYKKNFDSTSKERFAAIQGRANKILGVWQDNDRKRLLDDIISKAFGKYPEGCLMTPDMINKVSEDIAKAIADYVVGRQKM